MSEKSDNNETTLTDDENINDNHEINSKDEDINDDNYEIDSKDNDINDDNYETDSKDNDINDDIHEINSNDDDNINNDNQNNDISNFLENNRLKNESNYDPFRGSALLVRHATSSSTDQSTDTNTEPEHNMTELVVLDPNHPLMNRFQDALREMLIKHLTRVELQHREIREDLKKKTLEHSELGNELYAVQSELAQFQCQLDELQENYQNAKLEHEDVVENLKDAKIKYNIEKERFDREYKKMQDLRNEMDNLALRLYYLKQAKDAVKGDIAVMKRAAEKAVEDLYKAEKEKMQQDYILDKLVTEVDKLKEDIEVYEAQLISQDEEKCAVRQTLRESDGEIQNIIGETKHLKNKWNSSLLDLTRRNEALCALNEALHEKREQILVVKNEIDGLRRLTREKQDVNEKVMLIMKKSELDYANLKKQIQNTQNKISILNEDYSKSVLILQKQESILLLINEEKRDELIKSDNYENDIRYLTTLRHDLEDKIEKELKNKLTLDSAKTVTKKLIKHTRDQTRELESKVVLLDNKLSKEGLKIAEIKSDIIQIDKYKALLDKEISDTNDIINKLEVEMHRTKVAVEHKQDVIDRLNKQYSLLLQSRGGVEIGPLECTINHLNKSISLATEESSNLEQKWLRQQHDMVELLNEKDELNNEISLLKQQVVLLTQRKIRITGYIEIEEKQRRDIQKELFNIQNLMFKVNAYIDKETKSKDTIEHDLGISETDLIRELKEEEKATIELQSKIDDIEREKNILLQDVLEIQWQIMMYDKKIHMIQEAHTTLNSDLGQGEVKIMKSEIHRMEIRFNQMKMQQEMLIQEMERSVAKRDIITTRGEALEKISDKVTTKGAIERKIQQLQRKILNTQEETQDVEEKTEDYKKELESYSALYHEEKERTETLKKKVALMETQLQEFKDDRYILFMDLQKKQQLSKHFNELRNKRYSRNAKTSITFNKEKHKCYEKLHNIILVVGRLMNEYPQVQECLNPVYQSLQKNVQEMDELKGLASQI